MTIAANYYVDLGHGDDSAAGTSTSVPWNTFDKVMQTCLPGQTVAVRCQETTYILPNTLPAWTNIPSVTYGPRLTFVAVDSNWDEPELGIYPVVVDGNSTITAMCDLVTQAIATWRMMNWRNFHCTRFTVSFVNTNAAYTGSGFMNFYNCKASLMPNGFAASFSPAHFTQSKYMYCVALNLTNYGYMAFGSTTVAYCYSESCAVGFGHSYQGFYSHCVAKSCTVGLVLGGTTNQIGQGNINKCMFIDCPVGARGHSSGTGRGQIIFSRNLFVNCSTVAIDLGTLATHFSDALIVDNFYYNCVLFIRNHDTGGAYYDKNNVELTESPFVDYAAGDYRIKTTSPLIELKRKVMSGTGYSYDSAGMNAMSLLPRIDDVAPNTSVAIGDTVTVTGIFSSSGNSSTIGGIAASIVSESASTIQVTVPAGLLPSAVVDLIITDANGNTCTAPNTLRIVASSVSDLVIRDVDIREWDSDGNESVLIEVVNGSITGNSVLAGTTPVDIITESETLIKVRTPALAVGTYDLTVTAADLRTDSFVDCITVKDITAYDPKFPEIYDVYRMAEITENGIGETLAPNVDNLEWVGSVHAMVNTGDSLEPDVRGTGKDVGQDLTSMWLGWFKVPNFDMKTGDIIKSTTAADRIFQIQYFDKYPGGKVPSHHWEARLQTTEIFRGNA